MRDPVRTSVEVLARGQDPGGAFVAAPDFPAYRYCWIRVPLVVFFAFQRYFVQGLLAGAQK